MHCGSGSSGGPRPSVADYVMGTGIPRGQPLPEAPSVDYPRTKCQGADKDKPIVGLVIVKDLGPSGDRYKGGTILDPEDGKIYKAEIWSEEGKLKVRGYLGPF